MYLLTNFSVSRNHAQYRATTHQFKIGLSTHTLVQEVKEDLPLYSYSFVTLDHIIKIKERNEAEHLIGYEQTCVYVFPLSFLHTDIIGLLQNAADVIAFVRSISKLETYRRDEDEKNKLRLIVADDKFVTYALNLFFSECHTI